MIQTTSATIRMGETPRWVGSLSRVRLRGQKWTDGLRSDLKTPENIGKSEATNSYVYMTLTSIDTNLGAQSLDAATVGG